MLPVMAVQPTHPTPSRKQYPVIQPTHSVSQYDLALIKADMDLGRQYINNGQIDKARTAYTQGLSAAKKQLPANHPITGFFLIQLSTTYMLEQNFDKACSLLAEGVAILDKTPALQATAQKLKGLGTMLNSFQSGLTALKAQDYALAEQNFLTALATGQETGEPTLISVALSSIGLAQVMQDKSTQAEQTLNQALQYAQKAHIKETQAMALLGYEELYARRGDIAQARQKFDEAITVGDTLFSRLKITQSLIEQEHRRLDIIEQALNTAQAPATAPDYFVDAQYHQKVLRWNDQTRVIKVHITSGESIPGWKPEYIDQFKNACLVWQNVLHNQIRFEFTENPAENVDTTIRWTGDYAARAGLTRYNFVSNKLIKADIQFNLGTIDHQLYDVKSVYKISLHELGHLLGIVGHSKNPHDIMFPTPTMASAPSERDMATIQQLYAHKPDISNPVGMTLGEYQKTQLSELQVKLIESLEHL
jgi:predicted Zn-dependent protease/Flp pilus assembly protein TadD